MLSNRKLKRMNKKVCGDKLKREHYGGGWRYYCPTCDVMTNSNILWTNANPKNPNCQNLKDK